MKNSFYFFIANTIVETSPIVIDVEVPMGFEPMNAGFANRSVKPLRHGTEVCEVSLVV